MRQEDAMKRAHAAIAGQSAGRSKYMRFLLKAGLFILLFAMTSCTAKLETTIRNDLSARMALRLDIPELLSSRVRQISGISPQASLFDVDQLKKEFAGRFSIFLIDVSTTGPDGLTSIVWVPDLIALSKDRTLVPEGLISVKTIPGSGTLPDQKELSVSINRKNASAAFKLFPGVDRKLLESMSPPALDPDPLSAAEYRMNLEQVIIGKRAMPAFDLCALDISLTAPKTIQSATGGTAQGQVFKARISLFDMLTLEKPIQFSLRWID
jgi:hypothetical protein